MDKRDILAKRKSKEFIAEKSIIFGENMRAARKQRGFTSDSLAAFLGISTAYVGLIERGERRPSLETFLRVCEFFGEEPATMLADTGAGLAIRETKLAARSIGEDKIQRRHKMILSMLDAFDPVELDHVVGMIKNFKSYTDMRRGEETSK